MSEAKGYEAATYVASRIAAAHENPAMATINMRTAGRNLAELVKDLAAESGVNFGQALTLVLGDERVSRVGRNHDVRDEAVKGFLELQEDQV